MTPPSYLTTFVHEVEDLLERIEAAILALETAPGDAELINQLFRAFHTLKGSAGVAGVASIAGFTHHVETAMDRVRSGAAALTPPLVSAVLASKDHVAALLAAELGGPPTDLALGPAIVAQLEALTAASGAPTAAPSPAVSPAAAEGPELRVDYLVTFTPSTDPAQLAAADLQPDVLPDGLVDQLRALGACAVLSSAPAWQFVITTGRGEDAIQDAFIFVAGAGDLRIERGLSEFTDPPAAEPPPPPPRPAPVPAR